MASLVVCSDMHARQEAELDRLLGQREHARDDRLRCDHGSDCGQRDERVVQPVRRELEEGIINRRGIVDQHGGLPEVIQHQRGQADCKPGEPDRQASEMSHVGVHRLAAGDGEKRGAENGEADVKILMDQKIDGIKRAHRGQHRRMLDDAVNSERGENDEPAEHHRAEDPAEEARAALLHRKQRHQNDDGDRHHGGRQ
jgi:hypothetical protein